MELAIRNPSGQPRSPAAKSVNPLDAFPSYPKIPGVNPFLYGLHATADLAGKILRPRKDERSPRTAAGVLIHHDVTTVRRRVIVHVIPHPGTHLNWSKEGGRA